MICEHAQNLIYEYLEGELTGEEKLVLEAHLAVCERCRTVYAEYARTLQMLGKLPPTVPDFITPAMERLRSEPVIAGRPRLHRRAAAYIASAAAVLLFAGAVVYSQTMQGRDSAMGAPEMAVAEEQFDGAVPKEAGQARAESADNILGYDSEEKIFFSGASDATESGVVEISLSPEKAKELQHALTSRVENVTITQTEDGFIFSTDDRQAAFQSVLDELGIVLQLGGIQNVRIRIQ